MFRFPIRKTIEAAGVLAGFEHSLRISRLRLLKLLYIADRESLKETGRPMLGVKAVAMDHGPLHSEVFDLVKGEHIQEPAWSRFFRNAGYHVERIADPGRASLSRYEIEKLTEVSERFSPLDDWQVADETHKFGEWEKNAEKGTSRPIPFEDIIDAVGRSSDKAAILQDARDKATADRLFGP